MLETVRDRIKEIDHWREREATRDALHITIHDFLYGDVTGLPVSCYTENEVRDKSEEIFRHVFRVYPTVPSPYYASAAAA